MGGREQSFVLDAGDNLIGSLPTHSVALPVRGVSRHHAAIRIADGGVTLRDLGSKNGTSVNGRTVQQAELAIGDEMSFGPVSLRLEAIPAGDAEIGLRLGGAEGPRDPSQRGADPGATSRLDVARDAPADAWIRLLDDLVVRLTTAPGDPPGALAAMVGRLGLVGAALTAWPALGEPVIVAAAGRLGGLPAAEEMRRAESGGAAFLAAAASPPLAAWATGGPDGTSFGVVLWGEFPGRGDSAPLLSAAGRLFHRLRPEPLAELTAPTGAGTVTELVFPPGYVPSASPSMRALYRQMELLAGADLPVLLCGETGVGKEPLARALHASSPRHRGPFVAVNCAAIPADLLEAELFGIGRSVATGVAERAGRFVEASGGTLLLDEIGDLPAPLQAKLLRALQEGEVQPVGRPPVAVDVRVVASTNRNLRARAADETFRRDLYYRIAGVVLEVPPLRQRPEDVPRLLGHFLHRTCAEVGKTLRGLTAKAVGHLTEYSWPGNVRELEHEARRLAALCPAGGVIDSLMLPDHILAPDPALAAPFALETSAALDLGAHTEALERRLLLLALQRARGNRTRAARLLGISRNGLGNRLRRLGIDPHDPGAPADPP
jgi:transcriptional regulator with AAA-type ATPase domain